ncbi:gas vesicle protein GvpG [Nocardia vinacea]|uniref:gas vesicle protein GvpG n=1 Tax=Nocardia vinacea TaxID=96468 RepID=UPI002E124394|nr:gas vesicle protein GvpG [Nocardia vinacea]
MGLVSAILSLPLAPVRGVIWLGELIQDQVEQQLQSPAAVRRELEEIDEAAAAGRLSEEERKQAQQAVLDRTLPSSDDTTATKRKE